MTMSDANVYFVGWDVGAWGGEKDGGEDAIFVLRRVRGEHATNTYSYVVNSFYGNITKVLKGKKGEDFDSPGKLLNILLQNAELPVNFKDNDVFVVAIDAILRWPKHFCDLINDTMSDSSILMDVISSNDPIRNKFQYRLTERIAWELKKDAPGSGEATLPLSAVKDLMGSQSTKALSFLRHWGYKFDAESSVWKPEKPGESNDASLESVAIETYPGVIRTSKTCPVACIEGILKKYGIDKITEVFHAETSHAGTHANNTKNYWENAMKHMASQKNPFKPGKKYTPWDDLFDAFICAKIAEWYHDITPEGLIKVKQGQMGKLKEDTGGYESEGWIWIPSLRDGEQSKTKG